jgi:YD repeat-containing protein
MRCPVCRLELDAWSASCPRCKAPIPRDAAGPRRWPSRLRKPLTHLLIATAVASIWLIPHAVEFLRLRLPLRTSPLVTEAVDRANDHPAAVAAIGRPITAGWFVKGYSTEDETGWGESQIWIPVTGSNGEATLYARAGRGSGPWVFTALELRQAERRPYLVRLGAPDAVALASLPDYYDAWLGLKVETLPDVPLDARAFDSGRGQYVAEDLIASLRQALPQLSADPGATVIAITEADMYIRAYEWRYAFNYRDAQGFAVVSSARMVPWLYRLRGKEYLLHTRVRKMVSKNIGFLVYELPPSRDPTSLLYHRVLGLDDLDLIQETFAGLGSQAVVSGFEQQHRQAPTAPVIVRRDSPAAGTGRYPCFVARPFTQVGAAGGSAEIGECLPEMHAERETNEVEVDLRSGALMTRETDLLVADAIPLALTRCYRLWDDRSRAFGIGQNHAFDLLPVGSRQPYTDIDLILADGNRIHLDRISQGTGYADAVYEHTATATRFRNSRFAWNGNGWNLTFADGSVYRFPEAYAATRPTEGALIGIRDAQGREVRFDRDRRRNLVRLTGPSGRYLAFEHDAGDRVTRLTDDHGRAVTYAYDAGGRLAAVTMPDRRVIRYVYVRTDLVSVRDAEDRPLLDVGYARDRVARVRLADGREWGFSFVFTADRPNNAVEISVRAPDGAVTRIDRRGSVVAR